MKKSKKGALKDVNCKYCQILNIFFTEKYSLKVKEDSHRLKGCLRRACGEIKTKFKGKSGSSYRGLMQSVFKLAVRADEVVTVSELETMLTDQKERADSLLKQNEVLNNLCEQLYDQMIQCEVNEDVAKEALEQANDTIKT